MSTLAARGSERLNPVLLKEVRAALRGRWFRSTFAIVLSLAMVASLGYLMLIPDMQEASSGGGYFAILAGCMALGVHGLVPFSAMLSMTAESDENTLELLQLSNLAGWRIVFGKLGSAMLQYLLIVSAFAPFLTVAFLMRGVAFSTVAYTLLSSALFCLAQCSVGIMLGSLARARMARIILLLVFALSLMWFSPMPLAFLFMMGAARMGAPVGVAGFGTFSVVLVLMCLTVVCISTAIAAGRLAHAEENQSTPMRVATSILIFSGIGLAVFADTSDGAASALFATLLCACPFMYFMVTERERLPRAVAAHLPKWSRVFPLQAWLPGGGRGALFVFVHAALIVIAFEIVSSLRFTSGFVWNAESQALAGVMMNVSLFLLLPSALLARGTARPGGRAVVRALVAMFFGAVNLAPLFLAFVMQRPVIRDWVPLVAGFQASKGVTFEPAWHFLCAMGALSVLANVPRIVASLREVSAAASRHRDVVEPHAAPVI